MAEQDPLTRFIPYRKAEVVELLCADGGLQGEDVEKFRNLVKLIESLYHFHFHAKLEALKDNYFPFDPDSDVKTQRDFTEAQLKQHAQALTEMLTEVLGDANFEEIGEDKIKAALEEDSSVFKLTLHIDFEDFEQALVYSRGEMTKIQEVKKWFFFTQEVEVPTYERVAMFIRFRGQDHFDPKRVKKLKFDPGSTIVKLFKDIPRADLEMLFPNTEVRMNTKDKALMGAPALAGAAVAIVKVLPAIVAIATVVWAILWTGENVDNNLMKLMIQAGTICAVLGGYAWKQYTNYKNKRIRFLMALADNLYFKNLDNNAGVFHHLIDAAEEEECKEAFLAYYFLLTRGPQTEKQLDDAIEAWFAEKHDTRLDFEVDDALRKLAEMELGAEQDGVWSVKPLDGALERVDYIWDNFFQYN